MENLYNEIISFSIISIVVILLGVLTYKMQKKYEQ
jgi:hypothetical protein